jgi:hypothetical protein
MDRYYVYYHCIRLYAYDPLYQCTTHTDPLRIPPHPDAMESLIIPVHKWIPSWYHTRYVTRTLKDRIVLSMDSHPENPAG